MLFSQRAIFQSVANANTNFAKFSDFSSTTALFGGGYEGDCCKDSYLFAPDKTDVTSFFDKSGIADGYGWCGAVTFKYKTASNYTWGNPFWHSESSPTPTERITYYSTTQDQYVEFFMIDGVLRNQWDGTVNNGNFYPVTIGRKKTTYEFAITTEYGQFDEVWFDVTFDSLADRWLTLVWSIADAGTFSNFSNDTAKYGSLSNYTKESRYYLFDARTGELLGRTDKKTSDTFAGGVGSYSGLQNYSAYDWSFTKDISEWPALDFQFNNINSPADLVTDMVKVTSAWWSIGGTNGSTISAPFDPKYLYDNNLLTILDNHRPKTIQGRNAVINVLISGVSGGYIMGYRDAQAGVSSPANVIMPGVLADIITTDRP